MRKHLIITMFKKLNYAMFIYSAFSSYAIAWQTEQGVVISEQKIVTKNPTTHRIRNGALIGGVGLGLTAGGLEMALGAISAGAGIFVPLAALVYGVLGTSLGGSIGASTYLFKPDNPLIYEYKVKSLSNSSIYTVQQSSTPIPLNAKVRIIERNHTRLIRKI